MILARDFQIFLLTFGKVNEKFGKPRTGDSSNLRDRITLQVEPVEHKLSAYKSIAGTRSNYCYFIKPGQSHCYFRRYICRSCSNCKLMKTDPFTGVQCFLEKTFGAWKIGHYKLKPRYENNDSDSDGDSDSDSESDSES